MRRHKKLIWASATHFMVDFICAWMIINKIPGSESWYLKMLLRQKDQWPSAIMIKQKLPSKAGAKILPKKNTKHFIINI